ncbi:hypothetical protein OG921_26170 [Aldersonia sp. NBC_00410]|uniref:DUF6166 domain-containing protein n=1 Tax=Aldersonia sp. NBC_00410 TaxID=2975954 RepID=UPI00225765D9|nr:DUF6166 domain-containing protein [Aldersonia sp. NBC_00410]MCX5046665.1 hypothetical protein [Aldersonia sp. NBC_00410]
MTSRPTVRTYRSARTSGGVGGVVVEVADDGVVQGVLRHQLWSSPTGMQWGFRGQGPRDLARSLLIDATGDLLTCSACHGRGGQAECRSCRGGYTLAVTEEAAFEAEVVSGLGPQWSLTREEICRWREARHAPDATV